MKCLTRDLDFSTKEVDGKVVYNSPQDVADFMWHHDKVLPKATGNQADWSEGKRHCMTISEGTAPNDDNRHHIAPGTEAFAVLCLEGCMGRWKAIARVKAEKNAKRCQDAVYDHDGNEVHEETASELLALGPDCRDNSHQFMSC